MKNHWKQILTFLVLSSVLTELLSSNAPISVFFQPVVLLILLTVGYGFPILVIREIAIRKNLGLLGLFFLGIMYGFYNEALVAKTIFNPFHSPFDTFAAYGLIGNIRVPWALAITFWHALYAVIYPILFVGYLFPRSATESWVGKKTTWVLGIVSLLYGVLAFFNGTPEVPPGGLSHFIFIVISCALLWWLSGRVAKMPKPSQAVSVPFSWKSPGLGLLLYVALFFLPFIFSLFQLAPVFFIAYFALITLVGIRKLSRVPEVSLQKMVLVGLGGEIALALFVGVLMLFAGNVVVVMQSLIFIIIFAIAILKMRKKLKSVPVPV